MCPKLARFYLIKTCRDIKSLLSKYSNNINMVRYLRIEKNGKSVMLLSDG
jgi:hypothetical protein